MAFDLPRNVVFPVRDVSVVLDGEPHPFERAHPEEIAAHWRAASAANPALFDGEVALLSSLAYRGGDLLGRCHIVRYSTFLYWRSLRPIGSAGHAYTHAMLVSSDNALVAVRMGPHTVNAGLVYFAAGSFEPDDFPEGRADLAFNMHREVAEETGLDLAGVPHEDRYHAVAKDTGTVVFRRYFLDRTADELAEAIRAHVAADPDPEIEGPVIIRSAADLPQRLAPQMPDLVEWHFGRAVGQ